MPKAKQDVNQCCEVHEKLLKQREDDCRRLASGAARLDDAREDSQQTSPTHAYSHDPFVFGELKEWLEGVVEEVERSDDGDFQVMNELASWLRRLAKGGKAGFNSVSRALVKEG